MTKKTFFCKEALFFGLLLVKNDQMRNEKELIAFGFDMSSRINNDKYSTTTFLISFDCLIDALWEDFDRSIAEMCFHIIADDISLLPTIYISAIAIADDRPIAEKRFHIIADDRSQHFQRSGDRERSYGN